MVNHRQLSSLQHSIVGLHNQLDSCPTDMRGHVKDMLDVLEWEYTKLTGHPYYHTPSVELSGEARQTQSTEFSVAIHNVDGGVCDKTVEPYAHEVRK